MKKQNFLKQSIVTLGAATCAGLYVSPVSQILTNKTAMVEASSITSNFLQSIIPAARKVASGKDIYTSVMIAQAALESGWGSSTLSQAPNHNLFGVKGSYNGESVNMKTLEDSGNQNYYSINADFRKYPSYQESLEDYADKIVNGISGAPLFYSGAWRSKTNSYKDATAYLTGRYATDTAYETKLNQIIEQHGLTRYDENGNTTTIADVDVTPRTKGNTYTVVPGDGLYVIAAKTSTNINDLLQLNGLTLESIIYPNQVLTLSKTVTTQTIEPAKLTAQTVEQPLQSTNGNTYTVAPGDGLYAIARKTNTPIQELLTLNGLSLDSIIHPGQQLKTAGLTQNIINVSSPVIEIPTVNEETKTTNETNTYTIQAGDGLYRIAHKHGISLTTLLELNHLDINDTIYPGQTLIISKSENKVETPAAQEAQTETSDKTYTVQTGDGLWRIAKNHGLTLDQLKTMNGLTSNVIHPGQVLTIA